ncbi:hypothetical protein DIPPA_18603 [Diplonema papillatum]|nr:hypothetical protein DIPPA_18603 [Diplonema papillatum]
MLPRTPVARGPPPQQHPSRQRLLRFYRHYSPSNVLVVDDMLRDAEGHEDELFEALCKKYGPEPPPSDDGGGGTPAFPCATTPPPYLGHTPRATPPAYSSALAPSPHGYTAGALHPDDVKRRLRRFYRRYNPQKMQEVDELLRDFKGREADLLEAVERKYGPEPLEEVGHSFLLPNTVPPGQAEKVARMLRDTRDRRADRQGRVVAVLWEKVATAALRRAFYKWLEHLWWAKNRGVLEAVVAGGRNARLVQDQVNGQLREQIDYLKRQLENEADSPRPEERPSRRASRASSFPAPEAFDTLQPTPLAPRSHPAAASRVSDADSWTHGHPTTLPPHSQPAATSRVSEADFWTHGGSPRTTIRNSLPFANLPTLDLLQYPLNPDSPSEAGAPDEQWPGTPRGRASIGVGSCLAAGPELFDAGATLAQDPVPHAHRGQRSSMARASIGVGSFAAGWRDRTDAGVGTSPRHSLAAAGGASQRHSLAAAAVPWAPGPEERERGEYYLLREREQPGGAAASRGSGKSFFGDGPPPGIYGARSGHQQYGDPPRSRHSVTFEQQQQQRPPGSESDRDSIHVYLPLRQGSPGDLGRQRLPARDKAALVDLLVDEITRHSKPHRRAKSKHERRSPSKRNRVR